MNDMTSKAARREAAERGLYCADREHDACGIGFVANLKGTVSHKTIDDALLILRNLDHRGAVGADPLCGDGAGIMIQIPDAFYRAEMAKSGLQLPSPGDYGVGMIFFHKKQPQGSHVSKSSNVQSNRKARWYWDGVMCRSTKQ